MFRDKRSRVWLAAAAIAAAVCVFFAIPMLQSQQRITDSSGPVKVRANEIGGVVTGASGPEAGVWIIAETVDLGTKFARIVVSDDQGRYLVPDLPSAKYSVWVRGYGLTDSAKVTSSLGRAVNFSVSSVASAKEDAEHYPAIYWYSMLKIPEASLFPGTGPKGNGMPATLRDQGEWLHLVKTDGCENCHQLGNKATREIEPALKALGPFESSAAAWERRIQSGQGSSIMVRAIATFDQPRALKLFGDWTDRIAGGELPFAKPSRPAGAERNLVITLWDWQDAKTYVHDEIATDKRNPTLNANGLIYGSPEESSDRIPILDPTAHKVSYIDAPVRDPKTSSSKDDRPILAPSPYWGEEPYWDAKTNIHNPMFDELGRVWYTSRIRNDKDVPAFCGPNSALESAKLFPMAYSGTPRPTRELAMYDPRTKKFTLVDTCFGTHHLQFAADPDNTLWFSGGLDVVGWLNRRVFDATGDEAKSQMWTPFILDTNGNGKRDDGYVGPDDRVDPAKDKRIHGQFYGLAPVPGNPRVVWGSVLGFPGGLLRVDIGDKPPATALTEWYEVPWKDPKAPVHGFSPRGMDIDTNGVVWAPLASGHVASFDRRKCKGPLNGPLATGTQCPEGWTLYPLPGPQFKTVTTSGSAEAPYFVWVDQHDVFGMGKDVPIIMGNLSDSLFAFVDGKFITLRVPYPMGFFAKNADGRIDDAKGGWKSRGLWSAYASRVNWHMETGKDSAGKVVKFQMRPNPLAD